MAALLLGDAYAVSPATLTITNPAGGDYVSGTVTVTATADRGNPVDAHNHRREYI